MESLLPTYTVYAAPQVVTTIAPAKLTLEQVRAKLDGKSGKRYWQTMDELAERLKRNRDVLFVHADAGVADTEDHVAVVGSGC